MDTIVEDVLVPEGDTFFYSSFENRPKMNGQPRGLGEGCGLGTVASQLFCSCSMGTLLRSCFSEGTELKTVLWGLGPCLA